MNIDGSIAAYCDILRAEKLPGPQTRSSPRTVGTEGRSEDAELLYREAIEFFRRTQKEESAELAVAYNNLALLLQDRPPGRSGICAPGGDGDQSAATR